MDRLLAKYIFNEASPRERERVERWLAASPARRERLERASERLEAATRRYRPGAFDARRALAGIVPRRARRLAPRARAAAAAAAVILLAAAAWFLFPPARGERAIAIAALAGERVARVLPDGSRVTLEGPASLEYSPGPGQGSREARVTGTAYLEVKSDPRRPFTVFTALLEARVLGTAFQVEGDATRAEVLVREGRVRVTPAGGGEAGILEAGMSAARRAGQEGLSVSPAFDANRLAWKTGEFRFNDTPLGEIIGLFNRHFRVSISLPDSLAGTRVTASFHHPALEEALDIINQTLDTAITAE
ncbi:MAG: FecR domain-containing protein [Odoribacteraceae bacterium]|jgi:ferric-dicitrate binding protein FerR (iron transport regulator)|nr:FecR domain-containing protein [Odoribacteraceae bacterium]